MNGPLAAGRGFSKISKLVVEYNLSLFYQSQGLDSKNDRSKIVKETPLHILAKILHYLVGSGHLKIFNIIFENGWGLNSRDSLGRTPIHYAAQSGQDNFLKTLKNSTTIEVQKCWDLESKDNHGKTPLYYAVEKNQSDFIRILLKHVQNKNPKDNEGNSLLHLAVENEYFYIFNELMRHAYDKNPKSLSINDVTPEGKEGGYPQKMRIGYK